MNFNLGCNKGAPNSLNSANEANSKTIGNAVGLATTEVDPQESKVDSCINYSGHGPIKFLLTTAVRTVP